MTAKVVVTQLSADDLSSLVQFSCGDADLDDFLKDDAWRLQQEKEWLKPQAAASSLLMPIQTRLNSTNVSGFGEIEPDNTESENTRVFVSTSLGSTVLICCRCGSSAQLSRLCSGLRRR